MTRMLWPLLLVAVAASAAEPPVSELIRRLHEPVVLRGSFVQSRQIAGFKRPVESSGQFVVARDAGLLWHTTRPFESLLSVNRERLRVSNGPGQSLMTLDAKREPMLRTVNVLLQSVVVADVSALQSEFEMQIRLVGDAGWILTLQPKNAALKDRFPAIELSGATHVEMVTLREHSGDVTTIRFSDQVEGARLTETEAVQLQ